MVELAFLCKQHPMEFESGPANNTEQVREPLRYLDIWRGCEEKNLFI